MAPRGSPEDPKVTALRESRCLNPHPEQVTDEAFLSGEFFDARDAVQVKYEMVRRVSVEGAPVTATAAAFGYSRPSYYQAAAALAESGLEGLVPARPGPRGGHKLTDLVLAWAERQLAADPALKPAGLAGPIAEEFGVRVHPRSIERALARRREHSKAADLPAAEHGKEENPSLPLRPSPGPAAAEPGPSPPGRDAGQARAPGGGLDARYEQLRPAALHARASAFPLGLGVLTGKGVIAWRRVLARLASSSGAPARRHRQVPVLRRRQRPCPARRPPSSSTPWPGSRSRWPAPDPSSPPRSRPAPGAGEGAPVLTDTASSKVTAAHLARTALLYVRQSSLKQVLHNTESAIRQYDLRGRAIALGWAADQITVIDIDQGRECRTPPLPSRP